MPFWTVAFLLIALTTGLTGFTAGAGSARYLMKVIFLVSLVAFVLTLAFGRRSPPA